jgi:hypothetical protein
MIREFLLSKAVRLAALLLMINLGQAFGAWTDDPIQPGLTRIRSAHITELRLAIASKFMDCGGSAPQWSEPFLFAGLTPIRAAHLEELRIYTQALVDLHRQKNGLSYRSLSFTDPIITPHLTPIRKVHIEELRAAVDQVTCSTAWSVLRNHQVILAAFIGADK